MTANNTNNKNVELARAADGRAEPFLIADFITALCAEIKTLYAGWRVQFDAEIDHYAQPASTSVGAILLKSSLTSLLSDAFNSVKMQERGVVKIHVTADVEFIEIAVHDNGRNLTSSMIDKMVKQNPGLGSTDPQLRPGLQKVRYLVGSIPGKMSAEFTPGVGTKILLALARADLGD